MSRKNVNRTVLYDKYEIVITYEGIQTIDPFALFLLEIIKHADTLGKRQMVGEVFAKFEIPGQCYNIYENRLRELIDDPPGLVVGKDLPPGSQLLSLNLSQFRLSNLGSRVIILNELPGKADTVTGEYVFDHLNKKLESPDEFDIGIDGADMNRDFVYHVNDKAINESFLKIINTDKKRFIPMADRGTKIINLTAFPTGTVSRKEKNI
jgi:hypothetical protein